MDSPKVLILPGAKLIRPRLTLLHTTFRNTRAIKNRRLPHLLEIADQLHPPTSNDLVVKLLDELNLLTDVVLDPKDTVLLYPVLNDQTATDRLKTFLMLRHITYYESKDIREDDLRRRQAADSN